MTWKDEARAEITRAAYSADPSDVPVYRMPVPRRWWELWKIGRWQTVRGLSRAEARGGIPLVGNGLVGRFSAQ